MCIYGKKCLPLLFLSGKYALRGKIKSTPPSEARASSCWTSFVSNGLWIHWQLWSWHCPISWLLTVERQGSTASPSLHVTHRGQCALSCSMEAPLSAVLHRAFYLFIWGTLTLCPCSVGRPATCWWESDSPLTESVSWTWTPSNLWQVRGHTKFHSTHEQWKFDQHFMYQICITFFSMVCG